MKPVSARRTLLQPLVLGFTLVVLALAHRSGAQVISLPNGDKFEFVGVTYGTNHEVASFPGLAGIQPDRVAQFVADHTGTNIVHTDTPRLLVWFKPVGPSAGAIMHYSAGGGYFGAATGTGNGAKFFTKLSDENGIEGGPRHECPEGDAVEIFGNFDVIPRRSKVIRLNFYSREKLIEPRTSPLRLSTPELFGTVTFTNPAYGDFPQWQPDTNFVNDGHGPKLIKTSEGLQVALDADKPFGFRDRGSGQVVSNADLRAQGRQYNLAPNARLLPVTGRWDWYPALGSNPYECVLSGGELSDATGNRIVINQTMDQGLKRKPPFPGSVVPLSGPESSYPFEGTPWPTESAWRLTLTFKKSYDFADRDLVTFTNVPVPPPDSSTFTPVTNFVRGIPVVFSTFYYSSQNSEAQIVLSLPTNPGKNAFDVLSVDANNGSANFQFAWSEWYYKPCPQLSLYSVSLPAGAKTLTIKAVLQETTSLSFLIKPPFTETTNSPPR